MRPLRTLRTLRTLSNLSNLSPTTFQKYKKYFPPRTKAVLGDDYTIYRTRQLDKLPLSKSMITQVVWFFFISDGLVTRDWWLGNKIASLAIMLFCRFLNAKPNYHHVSSVTSLSQNIKKPLPQEEAGSLAIWRTSEHKVLKFLRVQRVLTFLEWADKRWRYHLIQGPLEPLVPSEPFSKTKSSHFSLNLTALQSPTF